MFKTYLFIILCFIGTNLAALPTYPDFFTVNSKGVLKRYNSRDVSTEISSIQITGLEENEVVLDIDIRPSTQELYALVLDRVQSISSIFIIHPPSGVAHFVGILDSCSLSPYPSDETPRYGIDFDPVNDVLVIVGQDTQNMKVNPETGACTMGNNLFFNGPSGRGSTPSRAVAFSNTITPSTQSNEYILSGVHFTITNTEDNAGCYKIRENVIVDGPFDIYTAQIGTSRINVPLLVTPVYNSETYAYDYTTTELRSISLETGLQETVGVLPNLGADVYIYGMATISASWTAPAPRQV